ncbi:MAG: hypothetical protein ACFBZ8_04575 [Opitutales bacterium]
MRTSDEPSTYLFLGASGSERRVLLADSIEGASLDTQHTCVLLSDQEAQEPGPLAEMSAQLLSYVLTPSEGHQPPQMLAPSLPEQTQTIFVFGDGRSDPVDLVEACRDWLKANSLGMTRVISIVHCGLFQQHPKLQPWFNACIHFSDALILSRREDLPPRFLGDFKQRLKKQALPCVLELARKGRVDNPARLLEPETRRLSLVFDPADDSDADTQSFNDDDEDGESDSCETSSSAHPSSKAEDAMPYSLEGREDPWLERQPNGQRKRRLPDIRDYLQ